MSVILIRNNKWQSIKKTVGHSNTSVVSFCYKLQISSQHILRKYSDVLVKSESFENEYKHITNKLYEYEYLKNVLEYTSTSAPRSGLYASSFT